MATPFWLLGLPFDVATIDQVRARIFAAADEGQRLVFATPNVSFLAQSDRDHRFREDILRTGLSLADGMPIVWLGRLLGVPFPGRVAGSDLLESLIDVPGPRPLRVFFFGGEEGAAEAAMRAVNQHGGGLVGVGAHYPGFVGVEEMSGNAVIDGINRSRPDLLVVALGAAKGHRWIEANRDRLEVPVISHLGAAINFIAGRLRRAPRFIQRTGLEWLWRVKEEPALFRRYARDGWFLARVTAGHVVPEILRRRLRHGAPAPVTAETSDSGAVTVRITGRFCAVELAAVTQVMSLQPAGADTTVNVKLTGVKQLDAAAVGWLYACRYRRVRRSAFALSCDPVSRAALKRWRADFLATDGPPDERT